MSGIIVFPLVALLFISSSALAYELVLMRLFSIVQWYHFAYMVISIALLGFGASGTLLAFIQGKLKDALDEEKYVFLSCLFSFLLFASMMASLYLAQAIPFSPFQLVWQKRQYVFLMGFYVLFFIPFFMAGCFIGLTFMRFRKRIAQIYFINLIGSGAGVGMAFFCFYEIPPGMLPVVTGIFSFLGFLFSAGNKIKTRPYLSGSMVGALILCVCLIKGGMPLEISPYKGISRTMLLPGAQMEYEDYSPLGLVQVVDAPSLRYAPGLSLSYTQGPPPQKELFVDGSSYGAVTGFDGIRENLEYLDYTTDALVYHVVRPGKVLVLNPGGGSQVLAALYHSSEHIQAVEPHPGIVDILRGHLRAFSGNIYGDHPHIAVDIASPREFMKRDRRTYDLIQLDLIGTWGGGGGGIYATGENYTYTVEAFRGYFEHLRPRGVLSASAWLSSPARTFLKLLALAVETVDRGDQGDGSMSIAAIRSWGTGTVLMKKGDFTPSQVEEIKDFCKKRGFDLVYFPGIAPEVVNRYTVLERPVYYETVRAVLNGNTSDEFYEDYLFNIKPPVDDRPYFFHFFKLSALSHLVESLGREWIPFLEWGYVILWGTLVQALVVAPLFLFLPLVFLGAKQGEPALGKKPLLLYFSLLGLAFMFIEMAFIQRFILLLTYPILSLALVLCTLMVFSGIGSMVSQRVGKKARLIPFAGVLIFSLLSLMFLDGLIEIVLPCALFVRCLLVVFCVAPLAFFMGMPFPIGLQLVSDRQSSFIPWVWGVNGVASVIAPVLASLLSVCLGYTMVMGMAFVLYGLAGWIVLAIGREGAVYKSARRIAQRAGRRNVQGEIRH